MKAQQADRSGLAVVLAVTCLAVLAILITVLMQGAGAQRKQGRSYESELQAEWLAQSALDRASARLVRNQDYSGETWNVPAAELGRHEAGVVQITVNTGDPAIRKRVTAIADFPKDGPDRCRHRLEAAVQIPQ